MSDLYICRVCLIKDVRGFKMEQYNLKLYYEQIMRAKVNDRDNLPRWFCFECATLLEKFDKFKQKCTKGQLTLRQLKCNGEITYESVGVINRYFEKLISPLSLIVRSKRVNTCRAKYKYSHVKKKSNIEAIPEDTVLVLDDNHFENVTIVENVKLTHVSLMENDRNVLENDENVDIKEEIEKPIENLHLNNDIDVDANDIDFANDNNEIFDDLEVNKAVDNNDLSNIMHVEHTPSEIVLSDDENVLLNTELSVVTTEKSEQDNTSLNTNVKPKSIRKKSTKKPDATKPKKFLHKKKELNPEFWKKIHLSEEDAMIEFKQRENSDKYLRANYKCQDCFKGFSRLDMLMRHMKKTHEETAGPFQCRFCQMRFPKKWGLTGHVTEHYVLYQCLRCDMRFRERSTMLHDDVHNGVKRTCEHCGKEFTHLSTYYTHLRMTHRSSHICNLCGASFVSNTGLSLHNKITHFDKDDNEVPVAPAEATIYCDKCDIKFATQTAYDEHLVNSNMHGDTRNVKAKEFRDKKIPASCRYCGKDFDSKAACRKHHQEAHGHITYENRTMCEICGASLSGSSVSRHMVRHTGERPFPCPACDKRFTQRASMNTHYRVVHLNKPYPKYHRSTNKTYRRRKKTPDENAQNDMAAFKNPAFYT